MAGNEREAAIAAFVQELGDFIVAAPPPPYTDDVEIELYCPVHEDPQTSHKPSARWRPVATNRKWSLGVMHCFRPDCNLARNAIVARSQFRKRDRSEQQPAKKSLINWDNVTVVESGSKARHKIATPQDITEEDVQLYMEILLEDEEHMAWLLDNRGLKPKTIEEYQWGWHQGKECYVYPVRDRDGSLYGARLYDPFHPAQDKKRWLKASKSNRNKLYGLPQADGIGTRVLLFEGEPDAMLAHQDGFIDAITHTGGAQTWIPSWDWYFKDKVLYVCYDPDKAGIQGRAKVAKALTTRETVEAVYFINLPDGMDYTEWRLAGGTATDFEKLIAGADEVWRRDREGLPAHGKVLKSVSSLKNVGPEERALELNAYISGKADGVYRLPKIIDVGCGLNAGSKCKGCPMEDYGKMDAVMLRPDKHDVLVDLMNATEDRKRVKIAKQLELHCNNISYDVKDNWHVEQVGIQDPIDSNTAISTDTKFIAHNYYDSSGKIDVGGDYRLVGRVLADPRNQVLVFATWHANKVDTDLEQFILTPSTKEALTVARPKRQAVASIERALHRRYADLSSNVTGIYGRNNLHFMNDLVMHSAISFTFNGKPIDKGWMDAIVIGDTRTGKTDVVRRLNEHYRAGFLVSGENASYAGLVGGSAEMAGSRHRIPDWGILPRHNMRCVQIDEAGELTDLFGRLSSVRTSGIAEVNKQGGGRVAARVRLLWLTNPTSPDGSASRANKSIAEYRHGAWTALQSIVGKQEDQARFDIAMHTSIDDVEDAEMKDGRGRKVRHAFTSDLCHDLVMFAWSRKPEQITFADGVEEYINDQASAISKVYIPPLVIKTNFNTKLARMSVSLATLLYSVGDDGETVVVRKCHVDYILKFVRECYDNPLFGYGQVSYDHIKLHELAAESIPSVRKFMLGQDESEELKHISLTGPSIFHVLKTMMSGHFEIRSLSDRMHGQGAEVVNYLVDRGLATHAANGRIDLGKELIDLMRELDR